VNGPRVTFSYFFKDGEEGYPGNGIAQVTYEVTPDNQLIIQYHAMADRPTPISMTNHTYFNLSGQVHGNFSVHNFPSKIYILKLSLPHISQVNADNKLRGHTIMINAPNYTPVDESLIITGKCV